MEVKQKLPSYFKHEFKRQPNQSRIEKLSDQDKKHLRIFAIMQMMKSGDLLIIINNAFKEKFTFNKETQTAYYEIEIIDQKGESEHADA